MTNNSLKIFLLCIGFVLTTVYGFAAVVTADTDGDWTDGGTWDTGSAPVCGDTIVIPVGITVDMNQTQNLEGCGTPTFILVEGTLDFSNGKKLILATGSGVVVTATGTLTDGGGGGKANVITIGITDVWVSAEGEIIDPTVLGEPFGIEIKTITDGDFNTPSTWDCNCIPDTIHVATIVTGHSVTLSNYANVFELRINGSLSIDNGQELYIKQLWSNNGVFVPNESTVSFGSTGTASIEGLRNQEFYNLTIKHGCNLTNNSGLLNLRGIISFESGSFDTGDSLNLISDQNGTGAIGSLSNGTFTGRVFSNRYVMSGATGWRFLTSCIQGTTLEDIDDDIITAGVPGSDYPGFSFVSIWDYDESAVGHKDNGYVIPTSMSDPITAGKGFWVYAGDNLAGTSAFNIDFEGNINQGPISLPVTFSNGTDAGDGWNLVANPYPCAIDWDATWDKTSISDEIHIFDPNSGTYAVYANGASANGGSNVIASNQAFWIKATAGSPQLVAYEDCKVSDNSDPFKSQSNLSELKIRCKKNNNSQFYDEIVLVHNPLSNLVEPRASKFISTNDSVLNICFEHDSTKTSILNIGNVFERIPLSLIGSSNNTVIDINDHNFIEKYWSVYLHDKSSNNLIPITENQSIDLGKSVTTSNLDLELVIVPKARPIQINPSCVESKDGSVFANISGLDNYISLVKEADTIALSNNNGLWSNLMIGEYLFHVAHPLDAMLAFDSTIILSPSLEEPVTYGSKINTSIADLVIDENFVSSYWTLNNVLVNENSNILLADGYEQDLQKSNANKIDYIWVDSIGCKNAHTWIIYYSNSKLIYPNPYSIENVLNIFVEKGENTIQFFNLKGQLIEEKEVNSETSRHVEINDINLPSGQYLIVIKSVDSVDYIKLIVNG